MKTNINAIRFWVVCVMVSFFVVHGHTKIFSNCEDLEPETLWCNFANIPLERAFDKFNPYSSCSPSFTVKREYTDDFSNMDDCGTSGYIIRNWVITDDCGDTLRCSQRANVILVIHSVECFNFRTTIDCVADLTPQTGEGGMFFQQHCVDQSDYIYEYEDDFSLLETQGEIYRKWMVSYPCGELGVCATTIKVENIPTISIPINPLNLSLDCQDINKIDLLENWNTTNLEELRVRSNSPCAELTVTSNFDINQFLEACPEKDSIEITYTIANDFVTPVAKMAILSLNSSIAPCDTSICNGDVVLSTQEAVDAFCGCEIIEGNLSIGSTDPDVLSNIYSLQNLKGIKKVNGNLGITRTLLEDLRGLEDLDLVGISLGISRNSKLADIQAIGNLNSIGTNLFISNNPMIQNLDGFEGIIQIGGTINLSSNASLSNINGLKNIQSYKGLSINTCPIQSIDSLGNSEDKILKILDITNCDELLSINGLKNIKRTEKYILIAGNDKLENIEGLKHINYVADNLRILNNPVLNSCCSIQHLIDEDQTNGYVENGDISIQGNPEFCFDQTSILEYCKNTINTPCDTSICNGDVELPTQASIDSFCGCEVIEGDLYIGSKESNLLSNIHSIQNLKGLKRVNGIVSIVGTSLQHLNGLENLTAIGGSIGISENPQLVNIESLSSLTSIGKNLFIGNNSKILNLNGLEALVAVEDMVYLRENASLTNIDDLGKIQSFKRLILESCPIESIQSLGNSQIEKLSYLAIANCDELTNLNGLEHLQRIEDPSIDSPIGISIIDNAKLENIDALKNIKFISNKLSIKNNEVLNNCCAIQHLLDDDLENGYTENGNINIQDNPDFCNTPSSILEHCKETTNTCENIQITTKNNQIELSGLTAANEIIKVFDQQYNILYHCIANSEDRQVTGTFPDGNYIVDIQIYDKAWKFICTEQRPIILVEGNTITDFCEEVSIQANASNIILNNIIAPISIIKVFSPTWELLYSCTASCESEIQVPVSEEGTYHIDIQSFSANWQTICKINKNIEVTKRSLKRIITKPVQNIIAPTVYPNPANQEIFANLSLLKGQSTHLLLYNQLGQLVWDKYIEQVHLDLNRIDLSNFKSGLYLLKIKGSEKQTFIKKILIKKS